MIKTVIPEPCVHMKEETLKDWLAKLDEEVNEFKFELMQRFHIDEVLDYTEDINVNRIAEEGADVCTVIYSICEKIGVLRDDRMAAQQRVNDSNRRKGRL